MSDSIYTPTSAEMWSGRVDSEKDSLSYRWHQVVQCLNINELNQSEEFALLGFACDVGVARNKGRVGAAGGPDYLRSSIGSLCWQGEESRFLDVGTITPRNNDLESAQIALGKHVKLLLENQKKPIIIGGGHETAFGHYLGIASYLKSRQPSAKLGILNIDAHFDLRSYEFGAHSGSPFLQALEQAKLKEIDLKYFVHGINPHNNTKSLFETAEKLKVEFNSNKEVINNDKSALQKLKAFVEDRTHIYLTICLDVFDAPIAPGVSAPAWHGIQLQKALDVIALIKSSGKLISMDICELNPVFDQDNRTAKLAGMLIAELLQGV